MPKTIAKPYTKTKGVGYVKSLDAWRSFIRLNGKQVILGTYPTEVEAICGRMGGELIYEGEVTTKPNPETQEFYDAIASSDNPYWLATAAVRSKLKSHEGVNFNGKLWVSYIEKDNELVVLGAFKRYTDAYKRTALEHARID